MSNGVWRNQYDGRGKELWDIQEKHWIRLLDPVPAALLNGFPLAVKERKNMNE